MTTPANDASRRALLDWYRPRRELYPWRSAPDPYRVLVSEVMLQQTQAARVVDAFGPFVERFPDVRALAASPRSDVIAAWGTLGYNRRAAALSAAARAILRDHGGEVPPDPTDLARLPGVGPYTAAAVSSLGYGRPVAAVDVNVRRVVARAKLGVQPEEAPAREVSAAANAWLDLADPGSWNQAVMDLGREVCRPQPRCAICPVRRWCAATGRARGARPSGSRPPRFEGSFRQLRGGVVRTLRSARSATLRELSDRTGRSELDVARAVRALVTDGIVEADGAALEGATGGRVRLAES